MVHRYRRRARGRRRRRVSFQERHRRPIRATLAVVISLSVLSTGFAVLLNSKFSNILQFNTDSIKNRPDPDKGRALNVLVLGVDKGQTVAGSTPGMRLSEAVQAAKWPSGRYRSDTLMLVHIAANRKHVYLVSIPRDTYTTLYDNTGTAQNKAKINAAFAQWGPNGTIATVEHLTNVRMKHLALINFNGFKDITRAVGGVQIYIPTAFYDPSQKVQWDAGWQNLEGKRALQYVRTRYGLPRSDFDRIARQQNFMRALMKKLLSKGTTRNPLKLTRTLTALTENVVVDQDWDPADMRALALSLRNTGTKDVTFLTAPVSDTKSVEGVGSIVDLDGAKAKELFTAMAADKMDDYAEAHPDDVLKPAKEVN
jgi:LCP family protein required for cell wall assembly